MPKIPNISGICWEISWVSLIPDVWPYFFTSKHLLPVNWVEPLEKRMVKSKLQVGFIADGWGEFSNQVQVWPCVHRVPVPRDGRRPICGALVMLACENNVLCSWFWRDKSNKNWPPSKILKNYAKTSTCSRKQYHSFLNFVWLRIIFMQALILQTQSTFADIAFSYKKNC